MSTDWAIRGQTTNSFMIKYFGQDETLVHLGRVGWQVPYGQPVAVHIRIDQAPVFKVLSHGAGESKGGSVLEFAIKRDDVWTATGKNAVEELVALLSAGHQITVSFPDGSEPPWVGQLDGSRAALQSFMACGTTIDAANNGAPETMQPFSRREAPKPETTVTQSFHPALTEGQFDRAAAPLTPPKRALLRSVLMAIVDCRAARLSVLHS